MPKAQAGPCVPARRTLAAHMGARAGDTPVLAATDKLTQDTVPTKTPLGCPTAAQMRFSPAQTQQ